MDMTPTRSPRPPRRQRLPQPWQRHAAPARDSVNQHAASTVPTSIDTAAPTDPAERSSHRASSRRDLEAREHRPTGGVALSTPRRPFLPSTARWRNRRLQGRQPSPTRDPRRDLEISNGREQPNQEPVGASQAQTEDGLQIPPVRAPRPDGSPQAGPGEHARTLSERLSAERPGDERLRTPPQHCRHRQTPHPPPSLAPLRQMMQLLLGTRQAARARQLRSLRRPIANLRSLLGRPRSKRPPVLASRPEDQRRQLSDLPVPRHLRTG